MMELHFNNEESYGSHEYNNKWDMAENGNSEIVNAYSADYFSEDDTVLEPLLSEDMRLTGSSTPIRSRNNRTKLDLSGYRITPRKMNNDDLIPQNNASVSGVIRADRNKPVRDMYYTEETQKNYMTIPVDSVDVGWIKRIWR